MKEALVPRVERDASFLQCDFSFVLREGNKLAHQLVVEESRFVGDRYWIEELLGGLS
ncbi:hypothetical protein Godav_005383 [Gossypium davidsonii]|uniref:Uncharacterized protein n=1 Tax=Gossypium davidsonii TaxID=34287 RepID=A0A7J8T605_GOSDV|nr:hypothetical protein [Gossypium davidsonii]